MPAALFTCGSDFSEAMPKTEDGAHLTGDAALAQLARLWPQMEKSSWHLTTPETPEQFAYVRDWRE